jgi:hypothetical protein
VDTGASRSAASSATAGTTLALLPEPERFIAGFTTDFAAGWVAAFAARAGVARVAEAAWDRFRATGAAASDVFLAELAAAACVTLMVGSVEPLPVAFFPPVVFAIAIPPLLETGLPGKNK